MTIKPQRSVFYTVFLLAFCFSGLLTILSVMLTGSEYYRMGLASFLVFPLLMLYGIRTDSVTLAYCALTAIVLLSGISNRSSPTDILLFMRILVFSYLIYRLVDMYLRSSNSQLVFRFCITIAMIQLPILLLQRFLYRWYPGWLKAEIALVDVGFGTFNFKGDAAMSFFLTLLVIGLLFGRQRICRGTRRWLVLAWLTLTVLVANAELVKLIILFVWGTYLLTHPHPQAIILVLVMLVVLMIVMLLSGSLDEIWRDLTHSLASNMRAGSGKQSTFMSGGYGRGAAIAYYLSQGVSLLGSGPSAFYDPIARTRFVGNTGHIFTFYSEIGLLGWLLSTWIFFLIAFPKCGGRRRFSWVSLLSFVAIQLLTFTTQSMNDISVMLAYCIVTRAFSIPPCTLSHSVVSVRSQ